MHGDDALTQVKSYLLLLAHTLRGAGTALAVGSRAAQRTAAPPMGVGREPGRGCRGFIGGRAGDADGRSAPLIAGSAVELRRGVTSGTRTQSAAVSYCR